MDNLTKAERSKCMSKIKSKNTGIERPVFSALNKYKVSYKRHYKIFGRPDIAFPSLKIAVFLDSDFWHGWNFSRWKDRLPSKYWKEKIEYNRKRDRRNYARLRSRGWHIIRLWGHEIKKNPQECAKKIIERVNKAKNEQ